VRIRPAETADVGAIDLIVERAYSAYVERIGRRPAPMDDDYGQKVGAGIVWVADDGEVAGLIVLVAGRDQMLVENVAVDPARQGRGTGRALMSFAEDAAREAGLAEMRLYTHEKMGENLALYVRLGYREVERREEEGFARVFLGKRLSA
jgi:ribosomal protein S18 acetylase RimI-like enzyme